MQEFRENYVPEGAAAYPADLRRISHEPSQCTTCGLCDVSCPIVREKMPSDFIGPMRLVVSGMRGGTLLFAAETSIRIMASDACAECRLCEAACPEKIPMQALARCYLTQINEVRSSFK